MAPALTEPGQTQNFKLLPSHSSPGSPTAAVRAVSDEIFFCEVARHLKSENILNGESVCLNGFKLKSSLSNLNLKPNRPRIVIPTESCLSPCLDVVSDCKGENGERSLMMNSDSPNQDQTNNMGLQKSHPGMTPTLESGTFLKESFLPPEVDQLFKNLGAAMNSNDIAPNMDELLQVFKSMESTVEDGTLEEALSAAAQEQVENVEADGMFPIPDGADLTSAFTNFERDIFNDVDMNIAIDTQAHMPDADTSLQPVKECNASERIDEARRKQFQSERRCEFLLRRLRKLQAKSMGRHASEEINGLMQETQRLMAEAQCQSLEGSRERRPPRTIAQMLRQFEGTALSAANNRHPQHRYFGSGSSDRTGTVPSVEDTVNVLADVKVEVEKVAGQLHTQFHMVESAMDSDVTASSSGGESCDEMVSYNNPHQQTLSILKRAAWRWAQERAGVASRWTWLQAQISDLEYRIRQHTEIHRQIRLNKGEIKLGENSGLATEPPAQMPNGFHTNSADGVKDPPECMGATGTCRTRPFVRTNFRKRKLLNTAGLHLVSKKAARPSNIRCGCRLPLACCALCTGRSDPTHPREQPDQLTVQERIALLDPAYHPVLSFPSADVPQSIHLEALMRTPEWQQKMQRAAHKSSQRMVERREREREREAYDELRSKKHVDHRKKYQRLKKPGHSLANIQKIKKKLTRGRKPKNHDAEALLRQRRKHKFRRNSALAQSGYDESGNDELRIEVSGSGHPSPAPSPSDDRTHSFAIERTEALRRKRENSYDIDNIVIPHSLASSARVEKLIYKEILTPKWRVVEPEPLDSKTSGARRSSHESDAEDVSDETVMLRHERCEIEERKRFMAYVKNANPGRARVHRRTDSRAGSSGANTPDPMSPNTPGDLLGEGMSPITSPPATPGASTAEHDPCTSSSIAASISSHLARRSRTLSQSRLVREDYFRSATPDCDEIAPFEPRTFPLPDDVYEKMLKQMPDWYPAQPYVASNPSSVIDQSDLTDVDMQDNTDVVGESLPGTPSTDTDSAPGEEDPNDPEWTIGEKEAAVKR